MAKKVEAKISLKTDGSGKTVAEVNRVTKAVKDSSKQVDAYKSKIKNINKGLESFGKMVSKFSLASTMAFGGTGLAIKSVIDLTNNVASKFDSVAKFSRNIGMSSTQLQKWQYAAERSGVSTDQFNNSIKKFSINVSKAINGEKKQVEVFDALGIRLKKRNGEAKTTNELMFEMADAYDKIHNAQDRVRVAEELFGSAGFVNLFEGGRKGIQTLIDRREEIGLLFSDDDAANAEEFEDILFDVQTMLEGIKNKFVADMIPDMKEGLKEFIDIWKKDGDEIMNGMETAAKVVGQSFKEGVKLVGDWAKIVNQAAKGELPTITKKDVEFIANEVTDGKGVREAASEKAFSFTPFGLVARALPFVNSFMEFDKAAPPQINNPNASSAAWNFANSRNTTSTSNVNINVKGNVPFGVEPDEAFQNDKNVNLDYGFTFGTFGFGN